MPRLAVFVLFAVGCGPSAVPSTPPTPRNVPAEKPHADARPGAETTVLAWLKDQSNDPAALEAARWGPDDDQGELKKAVVEYKTATAGKTLWAFQYAPLAGVDQIVRVRYRDKNAAGAMELHDSLVFLKGGKVLGADLNVRGDDWKDKMLKEIRAATAEDSKAGPPKPPPAPPPVWEGATDAPRLPPPDGRDD